MFEKLFGAVMVAIDTLAAVAVMPAYLGGVVVLAVGAAVLAWPVLDLLEAVYSCAGRCTTYG